MRMLFAEAPAPGGQLYRGSPMSLLYAIAPLYAAIGEGAIPDTSVNDVLVSQPASVADLLADVRQHQPDIVGISVTTYSVGLAREAARQIKQLSTQIQIVAGGAHFDGIAGQCEGIPSRIEKYVDASFDVVIAGEAENAFVAFIRCAAQQSRLDLPATLEANVEVLRRAPGRFSLWWRTDGELRIVPSDSSHVVNIRSNVQSLRAPLPRHLLTGECERQFSIFVDANNRRLRTAQVLTYRGCLFAVNPKNACTFCFAASRYSPIDINHTLAEIRHLHEQGYEAIFFDDAVFTARSERRKDELRRIAALLAELKFPALGFQTRADFIDEEVLQILSGAGSSQWYCSLGLESTDPTILAVMGKKQSISDVGRALRLLRTYGFNVGLYLLFGGVGPAEAGCYTLETEQTAKATIDFVASSMKQGSPIICVLPGLSMILPGTQDALRYESSRMNAERPLQFEVVHEGEPWCQFEGGLGMHAPGVTAELAGLINEYGRSQLGRTWA